MSADERVAKLPRWAQQHIEILERDLAEAEKRIEAAQRGPEDTDTIARIHADHPLHLPAGTTVRFQLGAGYGEYIDCRIEERRGGQKCLEIHGGEMLLLRPMSGNLANATVER